MPRVVETTVYTFDELSDDAKEKARSWLRDLTAGDCDIPSIYDDVDQCAALIGITIDRRHHNNPKATAEPAIYYSGFYSQGDGACFEGRYNFKVDGPEAIRTHAPQDLELHRIADGLHALGSNVAAHCRHRGRYYHSGCMAVNVEDLTDRDDETHSSAAWDVIAAAFKSKEDDCTQLLRDFADWIYAELQAAYEYQMSDDCIDDTIRANEYDFLANGTRG